MEKLSASAKKFYYKNIRKPKSDPNHELMLQIRDTSQRLKSAYSRFENECDEDLMDSIIYEIQSLKSLYRYQIKMAKKVGLNCCEISVFERRAI